MSLQFHSNYNNKIAACLPQPPHQTPGEVIDNLKAAVSSNDLDAFHALLLRLLPPDGQINMQDLYPVMFEAVRQDRAEVVAELLRHGMRIRYTFALEAIHARAKGSLDAFLQNGWDINQPIGETEPTVFAYAVADREMALWLLDHGADLNRQTYIDLTPMSYAVQLAAPDLVEELLDHRGGDVHRGELLQHAMDRPGSADAETIGEVLGMLLDRGAPLNATMYENHAASRRLYPFMEFGTPLHKAAAMGRADVVRFLLGRGADAAVRDVKGRTALECAERAGCDDVVRILKLQMS